MGLSTVISTAGKGLRYNEFATPVRFQIQNKLEFLDIHTIRLSSNASTSASKP